MNDDDKQWWEPLIEDDGKLDWLCDHEGDYSEKINELWEQFVALREQLAASRQEVEVHKAMADKHYELGTEYFDLMVKAEREIATLQNVLSRLVEVHDAMGGVCGTVRIAAEEALKEVVK
jgi:acetolactate synthase regulatory subunit